MPSNCYGHCSWGLLDLWSRFLMVSLTSKPGSAVSRTERIQIDYIKKMRNVVLNLSNFFSPTESLAIEYFNFCLLVNLLRSEDLQS
jgi:hypothetical protein